MEQWRKDAIEKLKRVGYVDVFSGMAQNMCAPFWWSEQSGDTPARLLDSGRSKSKMML